MGYGGPRVAGFSDDQLNGFESIRNGANTAGWMTGQGDNFAANTINGNNGYTAPVNPWEGSKNPYAGQNQYLDQMVNDAQGDVTKQYQNSTLPNLLGQFNAGGAYGGTAM